MSAVQFGLQALTIKFDYEKAKEQWKEARWDKAELGDWAAANLGKMFECIEDLESRLGMFRIIACKADLRERYPDLMEGADPVESDLVKL